jgi:hypothetical protein
MSSSMHALRAWALLPLAYALAACSFSDHLTTHCINDNQCKPGQHCYQGFCVQAPDTSTSPAQGTKLDSSVSTRADAGTKDSSISTMMNPLAADAASDGAVDAGTTPMIDAGSACQPGDVRDCTAGPMSSTTAPGCVAGKQHCENNVFGACVAETLPMPEVCNGLDDNCDGNVDEGTDKICYPQDQAGCTLDKDNIPSCQGLCAAGRQRCRAGKLEACSGAIVPTAEVCSAIAADENCDGAVDEGCACTGNQTRSCYTGPNGTNGVGTCKAGTQACNNGTLGACMGAIIPKPESCDNPLADDDCNGMDDDIKDKGAPCSVPANAGICRAGTLQCQTGSPSLNCVTIPVGSVAELCNQLDDDCNGKTDETFMLMTDPAHCGSCGQACGAGEACCAGQCSNPKIDNNNCGGCGAAYVCGAGGGTGSCCAGKCMDFLSDAANCGTCGHACAAGESCCSGKCLNAATDIKNCGTCGNVCSAGTQPACCGGTCKDLTSNDDCGQCGRACGLLGVTCACAVMNGVTQCVAPTLGICL